LLFYFSEIILLGREEIFLCAILSVLLRKILFDEIERIFFISLENEKYSGLRISQILPDPTNFPNFLQISSVFPGFQDFSKKDF